MCLPYISHLGHELGAAATCEDDPVPSVDDLANQIFDVLDYFSVLKECLLLPYFSKDVRGTIGIAESDIVQACRRLLDERQSINVLRSLEAMERRPDITSGLRTLNCRTLIFMGDSSPFHLESLHMISKLDTRFSALVEVSSCGSMVTEEEPQAMLTSLEYFIMNYGMYQQCMYNTGSPRSSLSPP